MAKKRTFLITKTIDFDHFLVEIRKSQVWIRKCTISKWKTTILQHGNGFLFDSSTFLQHWCPENIIFKDFTTKMCDSSTFSQHWCPENTIFKDFTTKMCDSSTFLQHWCPENIVKQRFYEIFVRHFYVFVTLMSGKQNKTTTSKLFF